YGYRNPRRNADAPAAALARVECTRVRVAVASRPRRGATSALLLQEEQGVAALASLVDAPGELSIYVLILITNERVNKIVFLIVRPLYSARSLCLSARSAPGGVAVMRDLRPADGSGRVRVRVRRVAARGCGRGHADNAAAAALAAA